MDKLRKIENGKEYFFYPGLGWVDEERLNQPDIKKIEETKDFLYNPDNSHNCEECPENRGFSDWQGNLPCGQQKCWVDCHCSL